MKVGYFCFRFRTWLPTVSKLRQQGSNSIWGLSVWSECSPHLCVGSLQVIFLSLFKDTQGVRLLGDSKLSVCVNVIMNGCLFAGCINMTCKVMSGYNWITLHLRVSEGFTVTMYPTYSIDFPLMQKNKNKNYKQTAKKENLWMWWQWKSREIYVIGENKIQDTPSNII